MESALYSLDFALSTIDRLNNYRYRPIPTDQGAEVSDGSGDGEGMERERCSGC